MYDNIFNDIILPMLTEDELSIITFFQQFRLLAQQMECDECDEWVFMKGKKMLLTNMYGNL